MGNVSNYFLDRGLPSLNITASSAVIVSSSNLLLFDENSRNKSYFDVRTVFSCVTALMRVCGKTLRIHYFLD